ncbi:MAG: hypothetical protein ACIAQF_11300, partial [Phycisphaerales bacterium JB065]
MRRTLRTLIDRVLNDPSRDYSKQVEGLRELKTTFHQELAATFEPAFNAALPQMPHDSLDDKRSLCSMANATLKSLGLAVHCARTDQPAIMVADPQGRGDDVGRFRLEVRTSGGHATRTQSKIGRA